MQPAAGQDLPHTRTHAVHWLATGVGIAALVMATALARPPGASATSADASITNAPNVTAVRYPVNCAGGPVDVVSKASADLDVDGRADTVAVVRCHTETGTPPSGVFVLSQGAGASARPRIVATLIAPAQKLSLTGLMVAGHTVSATLLGYSSNSVPRCCPDLSRKFSWLWRNGRFLAVPGPHAGSV